MKSKPERTPENKAMDAPENKLQFPKPKQQSLLRKPPKQSKPKDDAGSR